MPIYITFNAFAAKDSSVSKKREELWLSLSFIEKIETLVVSKKTTR